MVRFGRLRVKKKVRLRSMQRKTQECPCCRGRKEV